MISNLVYKTQPHILPSDFAPLFNHTLTKVAPLGWYYVVRPRYKSPWCKMCKDSWTSTCWYSLVAIRPWK